MCTGEGYTSGCSTISTRLDILVFVLGIILICVAVYSLDTVARMAILRGAFFVLH